MPDFLPGKSYVTAPWQPIDDWTALKSQDVEIFRNGSLIDHGRVDDVATDGSMLWLMHDGVLSRRIIENLPGTFVRHAA
ncbi:hypothetical protein StoSoilB20_19790 [Arthrobacter sp. StoSoilB20]|nr:hypothetical protein StoSoilB20_19790 [Arthrobacter sp. StoSoilB20]